jgi:hypothetical protein
MSQPALLTLSRTASLVGGLLWACLPPVFTYADSALDQPGTAGFALAGQLHVAGRRCVARAPAHWPRSSLAIRSRPAGPIGTGRNRYLGTRASSNGRRERNRAHTNIAAVCQHSLRQLRRALRRWTKPVPRLRDSRAPAGREVTSRPHRSVHLRPSYQPSRACGLSRWSESCRRVTLRSKIKRNVQ